MKVLEMIKAYSGLVFGKRDYWHPDMFVNQHIKLDELNCYYVDTRAKHKYVGNFDEKNIPLLEFDGELKYFPVTIAQYALGNLDIYMDTGDKEYLRIAEGCADWFVTNIEEIEENVFGYINYIDKKIYKLEKPWLSSLAQGQVMSVLARCYSLTNNTKYIDICKKIIDSFEVESKDKGVLTKLRGAYFYEEYPSNTPSYVLNGFIFSLWGILDYYIVSKDEKAKELYDLGVSSLKKNISLYNIRGINWSRYDLYPFKVKDITSIFYHNLHIEQLKAMYLLTNDEVYKLYYEKWEKAANNKFIYFIATCYKIVHKLSVKSESNYVPSISIKK